MMLRYETLPSGVRLVITLCYIAACASLVYAFACSERWPISFACFIAFAGACFEAHAWRLMASQLGLMLHERDRGRHG